MEDPIWKIYYWRMFVGIALLPVTVSLVAWLWYCLMTGRDNRPWVRKRKPTYSLNLIGTPGLTLRGTEREIADQLDQIQSRPHEYDPADIKAALDGLSPVRKRGGYIHGDDVGLFKLMKPTVRDIDPLPSKRKDS